MNERRQYGVEAMGGGAIDEPVLEQRPAGICPSCGAALSFADVVDPRTRSTRAALTHEVPFCHYFGETDPNRILLDVEAAKSRS